MKANTGIYKPSSASVDAYAYSLDLFNTALSSSTALILFHKTLYPFIFLLLFNFGIIDVRSLLPKRLDIPEITRLYFKNLLHTLVFNLSLS